MVLTVEAWLTKTMGRAASAVIPAVMAWVPTARAEPAMAEVQELSASPTRVLEPEQGRLVLDHPVWQPNPVESRTYNGLTLHLPVPSGERASDVPRGFNSEDALRRHWEEWMPSPMISRPPSKMHLWPESALRTGVTRQFRHGSGTDERSAWARWHSTLWGTSASLGLAMVATVGTLSLLPRDVSGWKNLDFYGLKRNFSSGPSFDYDHAFFNYVAHPIDGSEFYLLARNRDCTWWESFAYGVAVSTAFEFMIESAYEGASWQDLWITPVSGAVIGELRWQAKKALEDPKTGKPVGTAKSILHVLVDPVDALLNL